MRKIKIVWKKDPRDSYTLDQWCRHYTITTLIALALTVVEGVWLFLSPPQPSDRYVMIFMGLSTLAVFGMRVWMGVLRDREREEKESK